MGGLAFASGAKPLFTPRMPPHVYRYVRDHCHSVLRQIFVCVTSPIEVPAKNDYGDIDIFLAWERKKVFSLTSGKTLPQGLPENPLQAAAHLLKPERTKQEKSDSLTLAIPWPRKLLEPLKQAGSTQNGDSNNEGAEKPRFIQVDLHYYEEVSQLQWMLFKHAHGDFWNILGGIVRPFGLTISDYGLYLRIPEIEMHNRKQSRILLTREPNDILSFLGFPSDGTPWEQPFPTVDDFFDYVATCRFWGVRASQPDGNNGEQAGGEPDENKLKSKDRRRVSLRPLYQKWVEEFLPKCKEGGRLGNTRLTRIDVREEAFVRFGVKYEYEARLLQWRMQRQKDTLWNNVIKPSFPEDQGLDQHWVSRATSALKKIILKDDRSFGIWPEFIKDKDGFYNEDIVRNFVCAHWKQVGDVAWNQNQARYLQNLERKGLKRTRDDGEITTTQEPNAEISKGSSTGDDGGSKNEEVAIDRGEGGSV
ncbi:hypothetical protein SLS62_006382 [Diatrype stigma]|uniref:Uncharacterized protein n=1 Tax=Diatrype stigma TaxID=117547 RepID=A0AAN9UPM2_9PEZI